MIIEGLNIGDGKVELGDLIINVYGNYLIVKDNVSGEFKWVDLIKNIVSTSSYKNIDDMLSDAFDIEKSVIKSGKLKLIINK